MESPEPAQDQSGAQPSGHDERVWATFCHLAAFAWFFVPKVPLGNMLGPLVVWLVKREHYPLVDDQGKESLNFQISMLIYTALLAVAFFILMFVLVGFLLLPLFGVLYLLDIVLVIVASIKASEGKLYRYPLTIRLIK